MLISPKVKEAINIRMEGVKHTKVIDKAFKEVTAKDEAVAHKPGEDTQRM